MTYSETLYKNKLLMKTQNTNLKKDTKTALRVTSMLEGVLMAFIVFVGDIYRSLITDYLTISSITMTLICAIGAGIIIFIIYFYFGRKKMLKETE